MVTVSFPGLGIEPFSFNKVAFTIPIGKGIEVRWYGIIIVIGIILAFAYAWYRGKREGVILDDLLDIAIWAIIFGMIGARAYYVLTSLDEYNSFWDAIAIWNGGIAIYGAIIGGALAILVVCHIKKIKWQKVFDMVAPGVMIGQILGRWGNFFNGEAYGATPAESNPLYFLRMGLQKQGWNSEIFVQPTFLYESVWNLIGFIIINATYKKKKFDGQIFLQYITWYGFGRMFIEGLRQDSLYVGPFRISQVIGFACFVVGTVLLIINFNKAHNLKLAEGDYSNVYSKLLSERDGNKNKQTSEKAVDVAPVENEGKDEVQDEDENESENIDEKGIEESGKNDSKDTGAEETQNTSEETQNTSKEDNGKDDSKID